MPPHVPGGHAQIADKSGHNWADRKMPCYRVSQTPHGPDRHWRETTACPAVAQHRAGAQHGLASFHGREAARPHHRDPGSVCHLPIPPVRFGHDRSGCAQTPRGWNRISRWRSPGFTTPDTAGAPLMFRRIRRVSRGAGIGPEQAGNFPIAGTAILARCPDIWYVAVILPTRPDTPAECTRCGLSSTSDTFRAGIA